jgi:hypothetical protein
MPRKVVSYFVTVTYPYALAHVGSECRGLSENARATLGCFFADAAQRGQDLPKTSETDLLHFLLQYWLGERKPHLEPGKWVLTNNIKWFELFFETCRDALKT